MNASMPDLMDQLADSLANTPAARSLILETKALAALLRYQATPEGRAAIAAEDARIAANNVLVNAHNAKIRLVRQAAANRRENAAIRAAACTRCFSTHAGEC